MHGNPSPMPQPQVQTYLHFPGEVVVHTCRTPLNHENNGADTSGGICFLSPTPLQTNDVVEATLRNAEGHERIALKIRWCRRKSPNNGTTHGKRADSANEKQFMVGACLMNDADASRARMLTQICHIDAYRRRQRSSGRELDADTAASEWIERHAHQVPAIS